MSEPTVPVLHIEGVENLRVLNHLLEEIPVRYRNQVDAIFQYLEQHTYQQPIKKKEDEPKSE